jgi:hypothetical protein
MTATRYYRDLSRGIFTSDNQRRLNLNSNVIPVYSTWVTGDPRLVYYIDLVELEGGKVSKTSCRGVL